MLESHVDDHQTHDTAQLAAEAKQLRADASYLRAEANRLRAEIRRLRRENLELRLELARHPGRAAGCSMELTAGTCLGRVGQRTD